MMKNIVMMWWWWGAGDGDGGGHDGGHDGGDGFVLLAKWYGCPLAISQWLTTHVTQIRLF